MDFNNVLSPLWVEEDEKTDESAKKPESKKKTSADFVNCDEQILINCIKHRNNNLRICDGFSAHPMIQAISEASTLRK